MSQDVVGGSPLEMSSRIIWSLGLGFSPTSLMAGSQGFGVYSLPLFFTYQWKKCVGAGCTPSTDIPGAVGPTYTRTSTPTPDSP